MMKEIIKELNKDRNSGTYFLVGLAVITLFQIGILALVLSDIENIFEETVNLLFIFSWLSSYIYFTVYNNGIIKQNKDVSNKMKLSLLRKIYYIKDISLFLIFCIIMLFFWKFDIIRIMYSLNYFIVTISLTRTAIEQAFNTNLKSRILKDVLKIYLIVFCNVAFFAPANHNVQIITMSIGLIVSISSIIIIEKFKK